MTDTKHTDSVEATIEEILNDNRGETLYDSENANEIAADAIDNFIEAVLPKLQAHTSQQVEEAVLQADATGAYHSGYLAGKAEVEEAVRKFHEQYQEAIARLLTEYHPDDPSHTDKCYQHPATEWLRNTLTLYASQIRAQWLRDEIVKLEKLSDTVFDLSDENFPTPWVKVKDVNDALQTIIDRYQAELTTLTSNI